MNGEDRDVKAIEEFDKFFKEFKEATK